MAHRAARSLDKGGQRCWFVDALIAQGVALARLRKPARAQYTLQQAIKIALEADALNRAGLAALTMIEEVVDLDPATLQAAYQQAREWLSDAQSQEVLLRLNNAAAKLTASLHGELSRDAAIDALLKKPGDLEAKLLDYEHELIKRALLQSNGSVTNAGKLLG